MGHPVKGKSLHRVQVWFLHRMQGRKRSPPMSPWQGGCPEIIPKLRALPWWSSAQLEWLPKLQVRDPTSRKALASAESRIWQIQRSWFTGTLTGTLNGAGRPL